jgi:hypothetical protein
VSNLCVVELYANNLIRKNTFQTGTGDFLGCNFALSESGPRNFTLFFADYQDIETSDIVKIKLYESTDYFFMGVIRGTPIEGSTNKVGEYSGFGLSDYLTRVNTTSKSYSSKTIEFILDDLLDTIIIPATPIVKNAAKINPPAITITSMTLNYVNIGSALDSLIKIARSSGDYIYGVDSDGEFFFDLRSTTLMATLIPGATGENGIPEYNPDDIGEATSKVFLKDKNGTFINSFTETSVTEIKEIDLTAPDIDNTAAELWAQGILARESIITRRATIKWDIEEDPTVLKADGRIRIISNIPPSELTSEYSSNYGDGNYGSGLYGGSPYTGYNLDDTLDVKQVTYYINDLEATRQIELGSLPPELTDEIIQIEKDLIDLKISLGV